MKLKLYFLFSVQLKDEFWKTLSCQEQVNWHYDRAKGILENNPKKEIIKLKNVSLYHFDCDYLNYRDFYHTFYYEEEHIVEVNINLTNN